MRIGFTGTRERPTGHQLIELGEQLSRRAYRAHTLRWTPWLEHGDCIGADEAAHYIAHALGFSIVLHPPANQSLQAFCVGATSELPAMPYLHRNQNIVNGTHELIAMPLGRETQRSGTWSTVRYARSLGRPITIIMPDGETILEGRTNEA